MCWISSKVIARIISLGSSLLEAITRQSTCNPRGTSQKFGWNMSRVALFSRKPALSLKRENRAKVTMITNRKSHALSIGAKINDLEWPCRAISLCTLFQNTCLSEPTTNIWMKIDPYYQRRRCSPMTPVSGNKVCADIREGSLDRGRQTTVG